MTDIRSSRLGIARTCGVGAVAATAVGLLGLPFGTSGYFSAPAENPAVALTATAAPGLPDRPNIALAHNGEAIFDAAQNTAGFFAFEDFLTSIGL